MKIKLNVTKDLKRNLKIKAKQKEQERNEYIYEVINNFVEEKKLVWGSKIEEIITNVNADEIENEHKAKACMKKTIKKQQPIVLKVEAKTYYALEIVAEQMEESKEEILIKLLTNIVK